MSIIIERRSNTDRLIDAERLEDVLPTDEDIRLEAQEEEEDDDTGRF